MPAENARVSLFILLDFTRQAHIRSNKTICSENYWSMAQAAGGSQSGNNSRCYSRNQLHNKLYCLFLAHSFNLLIVLHCHLERSREISPCALLSRDDRGSKRGAFAPSA